ncbi:response regulator [Striga asiatica]|uniref:Response regulator n=1 Tax=Striga asiatica TaxID=4170 RepID=A0A5A7RKI8_STRAF|nr:response regulator [Striga asiatica]
MVRMRKKINSHGFYRLKWLGIRHGLCPASSQTSRTYVFPSPVLVIPFLGRKGRRCAELDSICHQTLGITGNATYSWMKSNAWRINYSNDICKLPNRDKFTSKPLKLPIIEKEALKSITIPTRSAKVRPIVPVPQQTSKSKVLGPNPAQSPASEYNFSAARTLYFSSFRSIVFASSCPIKNAEF